MSCPEGEPVNTRAVVFAAATCAAAVLASQLAGKAARDAIFLQRFPVTNLPLLLAVSSALAIGTTFMFARRLSRGVPARVVQIANVASAALLVVEWLLLDHLPRPVATVIYMHQTLLGPILVSGFWSIVSECFDPRTARRVVGSIGTGATIGGFLGAVLAERVAALAGTSALLPTIAALQLFATWRLGVFARNGAVVAADDGEPPPQIQEIARKITRVSLLRRLALITVTVTIAAALLDYVFKEVVTREVARSDDLARAFATFHGVVGVLTAVTAWVLGRRALRSWGLARTLAVLPGSVIAFGSIALVAPGLGAFVALRGAENVVRNSLYREAYEVFYTPLLARERRATKTIIDVGVERFGDLLGGIAVLAILALTIDATHTLLAGSIALSVLGVVIALKAQRSYVEALERSLLEHAIDIPNYEAHDRTTRTTLELIAQRGSKPPPPGQSPPDSELQRIAELRSGDAQRIRGALAGSFSPSMVAAAIPLLGRADVADEIARALAGAAVSSLGQLIDAARDPKLALEVRVRLPELIASSGGELARVGLLGCLGDREPEVRFRAAEALLQLREHHPELDVDQSAVFEGVRRELAAEPEIWQALGSEPPLAVNGGNGVPSRAAQHLATLLALALPSEPVKTAFHGLWSDDVTFRGVALEYLDNVLPNDIRERIWLLLAIEAPALGARRPVEDVRAELLRSHERRVVVS